MATTSTSISSDIPDILKPYYIGDQAQGIQGILQKGTELFTKDYDTVYGNALKAAGLEGAGRIADLSPEQQSTIKNIMDQQLPGSFAAAASYGSSGASALKGLQSLTPDQVKAKEIQQFQMNQPANVAGSTQNVAPTMRTAQTDYAPDIQTFQMNQPRDVQAADDVRAQALKDYSMQGPAKFDADATSQYMSPYMQQVMDVQKAEAIRDAQKANLSGNLGAARQGTYGGARNALAQAERERNLNTQLGNIQATGLQSAFDKAMQQFNTSTGAEQAAAAKNLEALLSTQQLSAGQSLEAQKANQAMQQQAALANQQAGLTTGQQNLAAQQAAQQLGVQTGAQMSLANLSAEQQANVQNQAAQLQTQGLNADQAMKAALANQQAALTTGQQNLAANLSTQQLGADQELKAQLANQQAELQAAGIQKDAALGLGSLAGTMGQVGALQSAAGTDLLKTQAAAGDLTRSVEQQQKDAEYNQLMTEQGYGQQQLGQMANLLAKTPLNDQSQTVTTPPPSLASQLSGVGLAGAGVYNMLK
jgi:hypothetical protein